MPNVDPSFRQEILAQMPDSLSRLIEQIKRDPEFIRLLSKAFSKKETICSRCGEVLIILDALAENIGEHYGVDDPLELESAILESGLPEIADGDHCISHGQK